jgi:hypothetical protein
MAARIESTVISELAATDPMWCGGCIIISRGRKSQNVFFSNCTTFILSCPTCLFSSQKRSWKFYWQKNDHTLTVGRLANKMPLSLCWNYQTTCIWGLKSIYIVPMHGLKMPAKNWDLVSIYSRPLSPLKGWRTTASSPKKRPIYLVVCYVL